MHKDDGLMPQTFLYTVKVLLKAKVSAVTHDFAFSRRLEKDYIDSSEENGDKSILMLLLNEQNQISVRNSNGLQMKYMQIF
jgi:hypothetical protein